MMAAFVFVQLSGVSDFGGAEAIHSGLHAVLGVKTVHFVAGPTDIIVFVEAADQKALVESVGKMRAVKGVGTTDTRIVVSP
jgi:uncharacterized protein with GYD domain